VQLKEQETMLDSKKQDYQQLVYEKERILSNMVPKTWLDELKADMVQYKVDLRRKT
jgi:hypothetical protein